MSCGICSCFRTNQVTSMEDLQPISRARTLEPHGRHPIEFNSAASTQDLPLAQRIAKLNPTIILVENRKVPADYREVAVEIRMDQDIHISLDAIFMEPR